MKLLDTLYIHVYLSFNIIIVISFLIRNPDNPADPYYQVGLVSYGPRRCGSGGAGVYTNVASYTEWIKETIKREK